MSSGVRKRWKTALRQTSLNPSVWLASNSVAVPVHLWAIAGLTAIERRNAIRASSIAPRIIGIWGRGMIPTQISGGLDGGVQQLRQPICD